MQSLYPPRALPRYFNTTVLVIAALLMIVWTWSFTITRMAQDKESGLARAQADLTSTASALEEHSLATIRHTDDVLRILKYHYEGKESKDFDLLKAYFDQNIIDTKFLDQVGIVNSKGAYEFSNLKDSTPPDFSDHPHFRNHAENPDAHAVLVSQPVLEPGSGKRLIHLTRRLEKPDGSFLGVAVASLDPNHLLNDRPVDLGPNNVIGLMGLDGHPRALHIGEKAYAEDMPHIDLPDGMRNARSGTFVSAELFDHVPRLYAFERVGDQPLVMLVGMLESEALKEYHRNRNTLLLSSGLLSGLILLVIGIAAQYVRHARQISAERDESYLMLNQVKREELEMSKRLTQSEKLAALGQLSAGVAHEINNPIGFIGSNLNTLRKYASIFEQLIQAAQTLRHGQISAEEFDALQRKLNYEFVISDLYQMLAETEEGVVRVKKIVNDLKSFARADHQQEWELNNLYDGLLSTLNIANHEIKHRADIRMEWIDLPPIECAPSQLNQVFLNLIINAAQSIPEGRRGTIKLRSGLEGERVWIEVEDDGCGMTPEQMNRIFEPYYTTKPQGVGTGLGLSVSMGIVQRHQGSLVAFSAKDHGSCFRVTLPLRQTPAPTDGQGIDEDRKDAQDA